MDKPVISMIAALSQNNVIGRDNHLPWRIPEDMKHFREITRGHVVIMGRKTFQSMKKPLPERTNIVVTRDLNFVATGCLVVHSVEEAIDEASKSETSEIFIIGGAEIYKAALTYTNRLYLTIIHQDFEGDTFFPPYPQFTKILDQTLHNNAEYTYEFLTLEK
jgi:dihydrofolate reductase